MAQTLIVLRDCQAVIERLGVLDRIKQFILN